MRKVYTVGETLLDIIFKNDVPVAAKAGGSMLNSGVSLGRLKIPVFMLSEYGDDKTGDVVKEFLWKNGVSMQFAHRYRGRTSVALAYLDDNNDAVYTFFHEKLNDNIRFEIPPFLANDIVVFGSLYSLIKHNRPKIREVVKLAYQSNVLLFYDPNFRKPHLKDLAELKPEIFENIKHADIVRGSDEDFIHIIGSDVPDDVYRTLKKFGCTNLIYTRNQDGVWLFTENYSKHYKVPSISTVSTIGAGDSFNAGIIYSLYNEGITKKDIVGLKSDKWDMIIEQGINFATHVCKHLDNYVSDHFAKSILDQ